MYRSFTFVFSLALVVVALFPPGEVAAAAEGDAFVRFLHAAPGVRSVDVYVDGKVLVKKFSFQKVSTYASFPAGQHRVDFFPAGKRMKPMFSEAINLKAGEAATAALAGIGEDLRVLEFRDRTGAPRGKSAIRIVHLSPNAPQMDVSERGGKTLFTGVHFGTASPYRVLPKGAVRLTANPSGNPEGPTVIELSSDLQSGKAYSAVVTGIAGVAPSLEVWLLEDGVVPALPKSGMGGASPIVE